MTSLSLSSHAAARAAKVQAEYPLSRYESPAIAWGTVTTDRIWSCIQVASDLQLARRVPTYAYEFADRHSPLATVSPTPVALGAAHAMELPYLFSLGRARLHLSADQPHVTGRRPAHGPRRRAPLRVLEQPEIATRTQGVDIVHLGDRECGPMAASMVS
jgi:hypothetical protein